jgi:hypothetical protein
MREALVNPSTMTGHAVNDSWSLAGTVYFSPILLVSLLESASSPMERIPDTRAGILSNREDSSLFNEVKGRIAS